jgi:hypothetical protein
MFGISLQGKKPEENLFDYDKPALEKVWKRAIEKTKVVCQPDGQNPTIKDIRSGMACHLLEKGWTTDEIKSRLGHKPSSNVIDKYVNYKAKGKQKTRQKLRTYEVESLKKDIEDMKAQQKLSNIRITNLTKLVEAVLDKGEEVLKVKKK